MRIEFTDGWYYDYDEMTVKEQLQAKTFWQLYLRGLEIMPTNPTMEQIFLQEMNEFNAYASLLKKEGATIEDAKEYLASQKGGEIYEKLEAAKIDFFGKPIIGTIVSLHEFKKFVETIKTMPSEIQEKIFGSMVDNLPEMLRILGDKSSKGA